MNEESLILNNNPNLIIEKLRYSGLLESNDFLDEKILYEHTIFKKNNLFTINSKKIKLNLKLNEKIFCYESLSKILLIYYIENNLSDNFDSKKLYYPYKLLHEKINNQKQIILLFVSKDKNENINIFNYIFSNSNDFNSIEQVNHKIYQII